MATIRRRGPKVGRNKLCPCGSGEKFKRCCQRRKATPIKELFIGTRAAIAVRREDAVKEA